MVPDQSRYFAAEVLRNEARTLRLAQQGRDNSPNSWILARDLDQLADELEQGGKDGEI